MSLYSKGFHIGADMLVTQYRALADAEASRGTPNGVIAFKKNQTEPYVFRSGSIEEANMKYDELANNPGEYAYVYLFRDNKAVDEAYFTGVASHETRFETKTEVRKERVGLGWILGGVGIGLLAMSIGFRQRRS